MKTETERSSGEPWPGRMQRRDAGWMSPACTAAQQCGQAWAPSGCRHPRGGGGAPSEPRTAPGSASAPPPGWPPRPAPPPLRRRSPRPLWRPAAGSPATGRTPRRPGMRMSYIASLQGGRGEGDLMPGCLPGAAWPPQLANASHPGRQRCRLECCLELQTRRCLPRRWKSCRTLLQLLWRRM